MILMKSSEAFVLRKIEYGESDYIVSLFTKDFGKISGLAKNAKKSRKRFGGRLEPFVHINVRLREKPGSMKFIEDAETIKVFPAFMEDIDLFMWGSFLSENIDMLLPEEEPNNEIFELLVNALSAMDRKQSPLAVILDFQLSLLSLSGYKPSFDTCLECGKQVNEGVFSIAKGGVFCSNCKKEISEGFLISRDILSGQEVSSSNVAEMFNHIRLLSKFTEYHTGKEFKSSKFIEVFRS